MFRSSLQIRLGQQLTMTPQLQQAIRLLQLPALELKQAIREALEQNVMLELDDEASDDDAAEAMIHLRDNSRDQEAEDSTAEFAEADVTSNSVTSDERWGEPSTTPASASTWSGEDATQDLADHRGHSLQDHLRWQLDLARLDPLEHSIGLALIDAINDDGYLIDSTAEVMASLRPEVEASAEKIELVLAAIHAFDPVGVGARSVAECIELQLKQLASGTEGLETAILIARAHLDLVATQQHSALRRSLDINEQQLTTAIALIRSCHPRPGSTIQSHQAEYIIPDVYVRRGLQGWTVDLNTSAIPKIKLHQQYAGLITRASDHAVLRTQLQEARWLLRSLEIRNETLHKVANCIVDRQTAFLDHGDEFMQPMVLRDVADAVAMHESTISRVTMGKYMHTPRGIYEFRHFFSSHVGSADGTDISSTAIRAKIRKMIVAEDARHPLSDSKITSLLAADGMQIARRTIAKYREALQIPPSSQRRKKSVK
jgi:RNA polymerase sigma-54 factor